MGKTTNLNKKANLILKQLFIDLEIEWCELCGSTFFLTFAHKHKRDWYKGKPEELLYDINQVLLLCIKCHQEIEYSKEKTADAFEKLRPILF